MPPAADSREPGFRIEAAAMVEQTPPVEATVHLELTPDERQLLVTALKLLRSALGREEAEELAEVQALLARLAA